MSEPIQVVVVRVGKFPAIQFIPNTLEGLREAIGGGFIEVVHVEIGERAKRYAVICDEDGQSKNLPPNRPVGEHFIMGDFIVTSEIGDEFTHCELAHHVAHALARRTDKP